MGFRFLPLIVFVATAVCQNATNPSNTQETCTTEFVVTKPAQVSTVRQVTTTPFTDTEIVVSTPSVYVSVTAGTIYETTVLTSTETNTAAQITDTYSSTSTVFETTTISLSLVSTVSETITTTISQTPSTVSITAAAGFTPFGAVFAGVARKIRREVEADQCLCVAGYDVSDSGSDSASSSSPIGVGEPSSGYKSTLVTVSDPTRTSTITTTTYLPFTLPLESTTSYESMTKPTFAASNSSTVSYIATNGSLIASPTQYPSKVHCSALVEATSTARVTYSANSTITSFITPPVSTSTILSTYITTSTILPVDASVTVTVFSTSTTYTTTFIPSTTTQTATQTVTIVSGATPTVYDACGANNVISTVNGNAIVQINFTRGLLASLTAKSSQECCVACQTAGNCGGSAYLGGQCYLMKAAGVCDGSVASWGYGTAGSAAAIFVSNGPCGQGSYSNVY